MKKIIKSFGMLLCCSVLFLVAAELSAREVAIEVGSMGGLASGAVDYQLTTVSPPSPALVPGDVLRITIAPVVTTIGASAFADAEFISLVSGVSVIVEIPSNVINIEDNAFLNNTFLTQVVIPPWESNATPVSVTFGDNVFSGCSNLTEVVIPPWDRNGVSVSVTFGNGLFYGCLRLTQVVIPPWNVNMPITPGDGMFEGSGIQKFTVPNTWDEIPKRTFYGCTNLTQVVIPPWNVGGTFSIGKSAFELSSVTSVVIPPWNLNNTLNIGDSAFYGCEHLTQVVIPPWNVNGKINIGENAFKTSGILSVVIPPWNVGCKVDIGESAYAECGGLTNVVIPPWEATKPGEVVIGDLAFVNTGIGRFTLSTAITSIGLEAVWTEALVEVVIPPWEANRSCVVSQGALSVGGVKKVFIQGVVIPPWSVVNCGLPLTTDSDQGYFETMYYVETESMKNTLMNLNIMCDGITGHFVPEKNIELPKKFEEDGKVDLLTPNLSYGVITFQPDIGYKFDLEGAAYGEYTVQLVISDSRGNQVYTNTQTYNYTAGSNSLISWLLEDKKLAGTGTVKVQVTVTQPNGERSVTTGSFAISSEGSSTIPPKPTGIEPTIK